MLGKMAIIGDGDSVLVFKAGGLDAFSASDSEKAAALLKKIAKKYQIIFITDVIAKSIDGEIKKYLTEPYPIIISIPSKDGGNGYGMEALKTAMEKALGVDILFGNEAEENK